MAALCRQFTVRLVLLLLFLLVLCFGEVSPARTKEKIYIDITSQNGCFRLLDSTRQIGCGSEQDGNTGVVYYLQTDDDWNFVLKDGSTGPYVVVLDAADFTSTIVRRLTASGRVNGVAVLSVNLTSKELQDGFSADMSCPNDDYGLYHGTKEANCSKVVWNPTGNGLLFDDLNIPIFSIRTQSDVDSILTKCFEPFNKPLADGKPRSYPLCAMQLVAAMTAAKDAETCIRRSNLVTNLNPFVFCDPLGDKNIVATLKALPSNATRGDKSVVVVGTRMDAMGMFYNEFPSADSTVTGIVTLLAAAKALWKLQPTVDRMANYSDVMFVFFQGESFDYIGSSRMLYEMQKGKFPQDFSDGDQNTHLQKIKLEHIKQFVELSQVGMRDNENSLWLHVDPNVQQATEPLLRKLTNFGVSSNVSFKTGNAGNPLPPASVQRFLMEDSQLESFVITDHQTSYTNKYYNSRLDLPAQIEANYPEGLNSTERYDTNTTQSERITSLATALARYLFWASKGSDPTPEELNELQADIADVNHMLYCFLFSPRCELFNFTISPDNADALNKNEQPFPFYVSVYQTTNQVTHMVQRVLAYFTGKVENVTQGDCEVKGSDKRYTYLWMQGALEPGKEKRNPVCYKSTVLMSTAKSPAFDMDDYDWRSGKYSTWTESRWDNFKLRVFLIPSKQFQTQVLSTGVILFLVSMLLMYWVNSKAAILFAQQTTSREYLFDVRS